VACALAALLVAGAATTWCRRWAKAIEQPLDWPELLLAGAVAACTGIAVRILLRWPAAGVPRAAVRRFDWVVSGGLVAWGAALSVSGTRPGGLALFWAILLCEESWAWGNVVRLNVRFAAFRAFGRSRQASTGAPQPREGRWDGLMPGPPPPLPGDVLQEFVRTRQPDGAEVLTGRIRVSLAPGQRNVPVHLAFCPPFASIPRITVAQRQGPPGRIKEVQVLPFGARLDVKLAQASQTPAAVLLEIAVRSDPIAATS
jgi:hypothetical protein